MPPSCVSTICTDNSVTWFLCNSRASCSTCPPPPSWFLKSWNFVGYWGPEGGVASAWQISSQSVNRLRNCFNFFSIFFLDKVCPPSWISLGIFGSLTHSEYLLVSITLQNLVMIHTVVFILWTFQYLARLAEKWLFTPQNSHFWAISSPKWAAHTDTVNSFIHLQTTVSIAFCYRLPNVKNSRLQLIDKIKLFLFTLCQKCHDK